MQSESLKVFLCHASEDKPEVRKLYLRLKEAGFDPWLDAMNLLGGEEWQLAIPKAVREAGIILVCMSQRSTTKEGYLQKEIKFALDVADEKPEGRTFIIPVRLTRCDIPERLKTWQCVDLFEEDGYERLLLALVSSSVGSSLVAPPTPQLIQKKICMLGSFGVGKTTLVGRFVQGIFLAKYLTTVGVKIDKKQIKIHDQDVLLMLWDLAGEDSHSQVQLSYLRGASGYLLVCDGTWSESLATARSIQQRVVESVGEVPFVLVVNKSDLMDKWEINAAELEKLQVEGWKVKMTSAKTGEGVEDVFQMLTEEIVRPPSRG